MNIDITDKIILECLTELDKSRNTYQKYKNYYEGEHDILSNYKMQDSRSNMKLVFNFPRKFVDTEVGYLLGKNLNFISKSGDEEILKVIDKHMSHWDKEHNIALRKQSEIFGIAWELYYINSDGEFASTVMNPLNTYVVEDGTVERNALLAVNKYKKRFDDNDYVDVYTKSEIITYNIDGDKLQEIDRKAHIFGKVPVVAAPANAERLSGFHDIIPLVDAFEQIQSDLTNEIADHRNAYFIIKNASLTMEDLAGMKAKGILQIGESSNVEWLTKDINDSFIKNSLENIERKIYDMMDQVNFSEKWASNTSSLALKNKLLNLETRVAMRETVMESVIKQRLKSFFRYIEIVEGKSYDYRDIAIKFTRNLPVDLVSIGDVISKTRGLASDETLLSQLPFVENPALELQKRRAEQESESIELDRIRLDEPNTSTTADSDDRVDTYVGF